MVGSGELATRRPHTALVIALAASLVVHLGALSSGFHDDDYLHLWLMKTATVPAFLGESFGAHVMVLPKLILLATHALLGFAPWAHMTFVLIVHLVNVALLYSVVVRFGSRPWVAGAFAMLWGTAPVHQAVFSWVSTHGFVFGTTTTLALLLELSRVASARRKLRTPELVRLNAFAALGALSLGAGLSVALVLPVVVWLVVPPEARPWRAALAMTPEWSFAVAALSHSVVVPLAHAVAAPNFPSDTISSLSAVLSFAVSFPVLDVTKIFGWLFMWGAATVFAGPILTVTEQGMGFERAPFELAPISGAVVAVVVVSVVVWSFARGDVAHRRATLGVLLLSGVMYGAIAVGRAQSVAFTVALCDRYHYAPAVGVVVAVALASSRCLAWPTGVALRFSRAAAVVGAAVVVLGNRSLAFANTTRETATWARAHVALTERAIASVARRQPAGDFYLRNDAFAPALLVVRMVGDAARFPGIGAYWVVAHGGPWVDGRRLRFVEADPQVRAAVSHLGAATHDLFVSAEAAERAGARVHSLDEATPPDLRDALQASRDPDLVRALRQFGKRRAE